MEMNTVYENETLTDLRGLASQLVAERIKPFADQWEQQGRVSRTLFNQFGQLGLLGLRVPEKLGGAGLGPLASLVLAEELGRSTYGGVAASLLVHTDLVMPYLLNFGSEEQQKRWLPPMMAGEKVGALAITEPDTGSDVASIRTRAVADGGGYRLSGTKMFITNGASSDLVLVAVKTDPDTKGSRGISIFLIERETPGFTVAGELSKLGWRSSDTAELVFDQAWVPADQLVGELNRGFYAIMRNFQNERLILGGMALGEAAQALELTVFYAQNRQIFGQALWSKQVVRHRLAQRLSEVEAGRHLLYHAAWQMEQDEDTTRVISMAKAYMGELVNRVMYDCLQFHGGSGYMTESTIERMFRDARIHSIGGGATEVMWEEVAKRFEE